MDGAAVATSFSTTDWSFTIYKTIYTNIPLKDIIFLGWTAWYSKQKRKMFSSENFWFEFFFSLSLWAPTINCYGWKFGWVQELNRSEKLKVTTYGEGSSPNLPDTNHCVRNQLRAMDLLFSLQDSAALGRVNAATPYHGPALSISETASKCTLTWKRSFFLLSQWKKSCMRWKRRRDHCSLQARTSHHVTLSSPHLLLLSFSHLTFSSSSSYLVLLHSLIINNLAAVCQDVSWLNLHHSQVSDDVQQRVAMPWAAARSLLIIW